MYGNQKRVMTVSMDIEAAFGPMDEVRGGENDLMYLADRLATLDAPRPMIFHSCGLEDYGMSWYAFIQGWIPENI